MKYFASNLKINVKELPFFLAYGLFLLFSVLSTSLYYQYTSGAIYSCIMFMCMGIVVAGEIFIESQYNKKQLIALIISFTIYAIISYTSESFFTTVGMIPILLFSARKIDFNKIAYFSAFIFLFIMLFVMLSAKINIIDNITIISFNGRHREFLGFRFPLNPATLSFNISALWVYYKKRKIKWWENIVLLGMNVFIYIKTDSKLAFVSSVVVIFVGIVLKYHYDFICNRKIITYVITFSFFIALIISLVAALTYDYKIAWMRAINRFFEDRIFFANKSLKEYGVTLLGEKIPWVGFGTDDSGGVANNVYANYFYVDNMYIQVMQRYGLIFFSVYIIINTFMLYKCRKNKDMYALIIIALIAFKCIIDNLSFYIYYNTFWFMISYVLLYKQKSIKENPTIIKAFKKLKIAY